VILIFRAGPGLEGRSIVALFGVGLIGRAILKALRVSQSDIETLLPLSWNCAETRRVDLDRVTQAISDSATGCRPLVRVDVVWAAGRAGFAAGYEELRVEVDALKDVIGWTRMLAGRLRNTPINFHMLSSAGGLFEGQRFVERLTAPCPKRPYGESKMAQESIVNDLRRDLNVHVYRPSSVYGFNGIGGRSGLLSTLMENAYKQAPSRIFGGLETVRDYVLSSDIGQFVVDKIDRPLRESGVFLLASGKPTSVSEMIWIASKVVGRPLYLKLDVRPSNANHITYRSCSLPKGWSPTDLETGVRQVARQLLLSFQSGGAP